MPRRISTTYGLHISTPIPYAPPVEELCPSFMRCVDWFRPASDSLGKRLQLPTSLPQHPLHSPHYGQTQLAPLSISILSPKVVLLTYPCTTPRALKPLIAHICRHYSPHKLTSQSPPPPPQSAHFLPGALSIARLSQTARV